jgi:tRNA U34 5-carboxymethylaminomethyl modifying GTPase MnmE/TrmE
VLWVEDASQPDEAGRPLADTPPVSPGRAQKRVDARLHGDEGERTRNRGAESGASGVRVGTFDASRNDEQTGSAPIEDAASYASSSQGEPPPVWRVRNKVDLIQKDSGQVPSGNEPQQSNEFQLRFNKPLRNIVNPALTSNNELKHRTNDPLTDMVSISLTDRSESYLYSGDAVFNLSAVSGEGFDRLLAELTRFAMAFIGGAESSLVTRARHRHVLEETLAALNRALTPSLAGQEDLVAEELRTAATALGRLTGRVDVEDILDVIFRDFCIGK